MERKDSGRPAGGCSGIIVQGAYDGCWDPSGEHGDGIGGLTGWILKVELTKLMLAKQH